MQLKWHTGRKSRQASAQFRATSLLCVLLQDPVHKKGIRKFELMSWVQKLDTEAADYSD